MASNVEEPLVGVAVAAPRPRRQRAPPPPPPTPLSAALAKNLILLTRCPRGSLGDRLGPGSVLAWRALFPALLAALVVASLTNSNSNLPPLPPSPPRRAAAFDLASPLWADEYRGPARRFDHRARVAFAPSGSRGAEALAPRLAAALVCLGSREPRGFGFGALFRAVPDWPPLPPECESGGEPCERNEACWDWLIRYEDDDENDDDDEEGGEGRGGFGSKGRRRRNRNRTRDRNSTSLAATPWDAALVGFPTHEAARRATLQRPDTFDALVLLLEEEGEGAAAAKENGNGDGDDFSEPPPLLLPNYIIAANATLLPPGLRSPPGSFSSSSPSLGPPTPHRSLWFVANLQAAVERARTGVALFESDSFSSSFSSSSSSSDDKSDDKSNSNSNRYSNDPRQVPPRISWRFKPFPWPGSLTPPDLAGAAAFGGLRLLFAYAALPPGRRAATALAAERLGGGRDALRAAGLSTLTYWLSHAAAHGVEALTASLALLFGLWSWASLPLPAASVAALLSAAASCAVVASAYFFAAVVAGTGNGSGNGGGFSLWRRRRGDNSVAAATTTTSGGAAAGDYFSLSYVLLALPGYVAASVSPVSSGLFGKVVWLLAAISPPSAAMLAGGAAAAAARVAVPLGGSGSGSGGGGGDNDKGLFSLLRAMLSTSSAPGVAGAPSVAAVLLLLLVDFAGWALAAALAEAALDPRAAEEAVGEEDEEERGGEEGARTTATATTPLPRPPPPLPPLPPPPTAVAESVPSPTRALPQRPSIP